MDSERRIFIRPGPFGDGFDVTVEPAPEGAVLNRTFQDHKSAFGHAVGLRMIHQWPVISLANDHPIEELKQRRRP